MKILFKIAWKNIWRSRLRSLTVMGAVVIGIWTLIFLLSFYNGVIHSYVDNAIKNDLSHIQLHHPSFSEDKDIQFVIEQSDSILSSLRNNAEISNVCKRTLLNGLIANARGSRIVQIRGINALQEAQQTQLDLKLVEGTYFANKKRIPPILISKRLADKMNLELKDKPIIRFQNINGDLMEAAFKIIGIYDSGNALFDNQNVFVLQEDLNGLVAANPISHEIAILLNDIQDLDSMKQKLSGNYKALKVETYKEISPDVSLYESQLGIASYVIIIIIMLALIFGIINTMLMAVLERTKELGMLMAIGMKKTEVFSMIVFETVLLGLTAAPIGMILGLLSVYYFGTNGLDLSAYGEGMSKFGMQDMVYTSISFIDCMKVAIAILITSLLAAIYPARKAVKLRPVEAMRKL